MHRSLIPLTILALAAAACLTAADASTTVDVRTPDGVALVYVNNGPVLSVRTANAGLEPAQRAGLVAKRISEMAAQGHSPAKLRVEGNRASATLFWGSQPLVYATKAEAAAQNTTPLALAESWRKQLVRQLTIPPVRLNVRALTIPVGENRRATQIGSSPGPFQVSVDPPGVAQAEVDVTGAVVVMGRNPGTAVLSVTSPDGTDSISVRVARLAGRLSSPTPRAQVTGGTIAADVVSEAVWRAARAACVLEPGAFAVVSIAEKPGDMSSTASTLRVPVNIKLDGSDYLTVRMTTAVEVERTNVPVRQTEMLFYSNYPEQVKTPQSLYIGRLEPDKRSRLLYHHQNGTGRDLRLSITLSNVSDEPAQVHLIGALAGPMQDTVLVGYRAGAQFLRDLSSNTGYVAQVPPRSRIVLWTGLLRKMDTASGIIEMTHIGKQGDLVARVISEPGSVTRTTQDIAQVDAGDTPPRFSNHQYPTPVRKLSEVYTAGGRWLFIRVGKHALKGADDQQTLYGNYGVLYDIDLTLDNPTAESKVFQVMFDPTAGIAGVASLIDGRFVGKSHVVGSRELPLMTFTLSPGERRAVRFSTLPLAGSNYPATIVVRS